ncbi:D-alanyl-D-alanine carboxypeptidase precursor [Nonomuraea coxensis DSM 45129]|uniref:D-alanyl-D-alanine carboxypeptidase n=2 Tax=Nonomuraea coxensis TaxID=404386 RepID=A0ABX8UC00_9ACTN|nr:D-alanyl-D-alanine carboxypeptidase precursor [Nonomuraea coxensis DSM 45129]
MSGMRIAGLMVSATLAVLVGFATPAVAADAPTVKAGEAYVVDSAGTIHFGKRQTRRVPVASLVKVMTAYVVLREARLTDTVTVTEADVKDAVRGGATTAGLREGERLTVRDLLHGLLLPSGADAASALARRYGPGKAAFVAKMNRTARALGLADTRYTNADGMPTPGNGGYSTAADQVKLAQRALADSTFLAMVGTKTYKVGKTAVHRAHTWRNSNELLSRSSGVLGVKTGYTRAAGYCLLFAAERNGVQIVGALLHDGRDRRFTTAERLLDYAERQIASG